jgi:hypothetical protein
MRYASVTTKLCSVEQSRERRTHNLLFPRQIPAVSASHGDREFRSRATARERSRPGRACCKALSVELVGRQRQSRAGLSGTFLTEKCECKSGAAAFASSRLQFPLLKSHFRSVLPVRREACSAFSVKMGNATRRMYCSLRPSVENFQFVSIPNGSRILTAHRSRI